MSRTKNLNKSAMFLCQRLSDGDANCDYEGDFKDIDAFVLALTDPAEYNETYDCDITLPDINRDNSVDFNDIDGFVECLVNGGCE